MQKDIIRSKAEDAFKHLLCVSKRKISTRHGVDKKRNCICWVALPPQDLTARTRRSTADTQKRAHTETTCTDRRVPGWRFCWVRSSKQCRCLFPFTVISRAKRWVQRSDCSHSDIRVGCTLARDPGVLQDTSVQSAVCTQLCDKQLKQWCRHKSSV